MLCYERKTIRIMYSKGILIDIRMYLIEISIYARPTVSEQHLVWHLIYMHSTIGWYSAECQLANMYWLTLDSMSALDQHAFNSWLTLTKLSTEIWINDFLLSVNQGVHWESGVIGRSIKGFNQSTVECEWLGASMIQQAFSADGRLLYFCYRSKHKFCIFLFTRLFCCRVEEHRRVPLYTIFINPLNIYEFAVGGRDQFAR